MAAGSFLAHATTIRQLLVIIHSTLVTAAAGGPTIHTEFGSLRGDLTYHEAHGGSDVYSFKGVPYGKLLDLPFSQPKLVSIEHIPLFV